MEAMTCPETDTEARLTLCSTIRTAFQSASSVRKHKAAPDWDGFVISAVSQAAPVEALSVLDSSPELVVSSLADAPFEFEAPFTPWYVLRLSVL